MLNKNKDTAVSFLEMASTGKVDEAYSKFVGDGFKHHNPYFEGSAEALHAAMKENAIQNPGKAIDVKRVIAEGEFVVVHFLVKHKPGELGAAVMQIFRFENGKIVEMWDLGQEIPEETPNQHGMF
ncbi:MAG: nuclear transport factor 2 family protein [Chloroflexi bacterium]|nr:nuclear transport factor 2 family protein [Chloroflexota bacterium]